MLLLGNFLMHFFCGFFPCEPSNPYPSDPLLDLSKEKFENLQLSEEIATNDHPSLNPIVYTKSGGVEGYIMKTIKRRNIFTFEGIPFGEPTGGLNRFKPPKPKAPWSGVISAKAAGNPCLQIYPHRLFRVLGSEDCLYLNVYTTHLPHNTGNTNIPKKFAVVVYVHGGSFIFHSGSEFGPAYLLDEDVILVTMNYRLGVLGFLNMGDLQSPGNNGLRDQELALKWVYENIEFFGGDRTKITFMGHSAGAASVHFHMLANRTRRYFRNAISLSGTAFHHWALKDQKRNEMLNVKLSLNTGCSLISTETFVNCLRNMEANDLVRRQRFLYEWLAFPPVLFGPTVEPDHEDAVITEVPEETYRKNAVYKIPWMSTMTADEGQYAAIALYGPGVSSVLTKNWKAMADEFLDYYWVPGNTGITENITQFYLNRTEVFSTSQDVKVLGEMTSDRFFFLGTQKSLQMHSSVAPTYAYFFKFRGKYGFSGFFLLDALEWGVAHSDDLYYIVNATSMTPGWKTTDREFKMVKLVCNLLANFAINNEPLLSIPVSSNELGILTENEKQIWKPIENSAQLKYLQIDEVLSMVPQPHAERLKFWESLGLPDVRPYTT